MAPPDEINPMTHHGIYYRVRLVTDARMPVQKATVRRADGTVLTIHDVVEITLGEDFSETRK